MTARPAQPRGDGRVPPHNIEAEQSLLGAALYNASALDAVVTTCPPSDFYDPRHQHIANAILRLVADGRPVDVITVSEQIRQDGLTDVIGGMPYLMSLTNATPSVSRAAAYAKIVHDAAALRQIIMSAANIADAAYNATDPSSALLEVGRIVDDLGRADDVDTSTLEEADIQALLDSDLRPPDPDYLTRTDGQSLLYAGKMHMFQAEPTSGKTWIALMAVLEVMGMGGTVLYIDFEDSAGGIVGRCMTLGAKSEILGTRFRYVNPIGAFGPAERARLAKILEELNPDLVIIDGVGEALARDGASEDKAPDVLAWFERMPRAITRTGAAVLMIDHVAKDPENRGRWARGSGAKLGAIDGASYQLKVVTPFSRTRAGKVKIIVAKDRPGGVGSLGETVGIVTITPHADGARVVTTLEPNIENQTPGDTWKPTHLMERVSTVIAESDVPLTASGVKAMLPNSKPSLVSQAVARLIAEGYVAESKGRTKTLTNVRRYTDESPSTPTRSSPTPPLPDPDDPGPDASLFLGDDLDPYE